MIETQLTIWTAFSVFAGMVAYIILTEGRSRFLFVISVMFSLLLGMSSAYVWLQMTRGLQQFSWALFVLPMLISTVGTILLLAYYRAYHPTKAFPKIPKFTVRTAGSLVSSVIAVVLVLVLAMSHFPSSVPAPAIATFGSSASKVLSEGDIANTSVCTDCIKSKDIMIQKSVVMPTSIRDDPKTGEYLDFKVELEPSYTYGAPSLKIFVKNQTGHLVSSSKIISYQTASNILEGQIYCDKEGTYTITAVLYDSTISSTVPLAVNSLSYTVAGPLDVTQPSDVFVVYMIVFLLIIVSFIWCVALFKKYVSN